MALIQPRHSLLRAGELATHYLNLAESKVPVIVLKVVSYVISLGILPVVALTVRYFYVKHQQRTLPYLENEAKTLVGVSFVIGVIERYRYHAVNKDNLTTIMIKTIGANHATYLEEVSKNKHADIEKWMDSVLNSQSVGKFFECQLDQKERKEVLELFLEKGFCPIIKNVPDEELKEIVIMIYEGLLKYNVHLVPRFLDVYCHDITPEALLAIIKNVAEGGHFEVMEQYFSKMSKEQQFEIARVAFIAFLKNHEQEVKKAQVDIARVAGNFAQKIAEFLRKMQLKFKWGIAEIKVVTVAVRNDFFDNRDITKAIVEGVRIFFAEEEKRQKKVL